MIRIECIKNIMCIKSGICCFKTKKQNENERKNNAMNGKRTHIGLHEKTESKSKSIVEETWNANENIESEKTLKKMYFPKELFKNENFNCNYYQINVWSKKI